MRHCWNVLTVTHSKPERMEFYNVFNHWQFLKGCISNAKKYSKKAEFFAAVHSDLQYYFWSKCEWEIVVSGFFEKSDSFKVDVYDQVNANFDQFIDYLWDRREYLKNLSFKKDENK